MKHISLPLIILFFALLGALSANTRMKGGINDAVNKIGNDEWAALKQKFAEISNSNTIDTDFGAGTFSDGFDYGFIKFSGPSEPRSIKIEPRESIEESSAVFTNPSVWFGYFTSSEHNKHELRLYFVNSPAKQKSLKISKSSHGRKENILALYIDKPNMETIAAVMSLASIFTHFVEMKYDDYRFIAQLSDKSVPLPRFSNSNQLMYDAIYAYKGESNHSELVKCNIFAYQQGMFGYLSQEMENINAFDESKLKLFFGNNYERVKEQATNQEMGNYCAEVMAKDHNETGTFPRESRNNWPALIEKSQKISLGKRRKLAKRRHFFIALWNGFVDLIGCLVLFVAGLFNKTLNIVALVYTYLFSLIYKVVSSITGVYRYGVGAVTDENSILNSILLFPARLIEGIARLPGYVAESVYEGTSHDSTFTNICNHIANMPLRRRRKIYPCGKGGQRSSLIEAILPIIKFPVDLIKVK